MLRRIEEADLELILPWRNAPAVRQAMYSQHEISWEEHQLWFRRMRADDSKLWQLYLNENAEPDGVVSFTEIDAVQGTAFWGFYAAPHATRGTGMRMSLDALDCAFNKLGIYKLNAEALASNVRSLEMHRKVGFVEEGCFREQYSTGKERIDVVRLGMLLTEWPHNRLKLEERIDELSIGRSAP